MEEPCQNWLSDMEMLDDALFNQGNSLDDEDQILREIMHQPAFSSDSESHSPTTHNKYSSAAVADGGVAGTTAIGNLSFDNNRRGNLLIKSYSSNSLVSQPAAHTATTRYNILSLDDDSTVVAAYGGKQEQAHVGSGGAPAAPPPSNHDSEPNTNQTITRKVRSSWDTQDHIMAERKRRRELTEKFIALSATIPGLKKIDKATILSEAINHVKRLQQRIRELEEQSKKTRVEPESLIQISHVESESEGGKCAMINSNSDDRYEALPVVEARVLKKDVLIRIHCKKQNGIALKLLAHLKSLDLSTLSSSVLAFGNSTLDISIIAQMGDKFKLQMKDLAENLRLTLLESPEG